MQKIVSLFVLVLLIAANSFGQENPAAKLNAKDSLELMEQLHGLLDSAVKPSSYVAVNFGLGNKLYSVKNRALNANQGTINKVIFSPSIGYNHKSGLGLTAGANLMNEGSGIGVNQYSLSPSFDLQGNEHIGFGFSYAHYFVQDKYSPYVSPIQDDWYASLVFKDGWLQPGIAMGYSTGEYKEARHKDTVIAGIRRIFYDTVSFKSSVLSLVGSLSHTFDWYGLLHEADGLSFIPTLIANAGSGQTAIVHKTNAPLLNFLMKRRLPPRLQKSKFEIQSVGLNLELNYAIHNFSFRPQWYLDYYLPAIDAGSSRISQVFSFNVGFTF